jgi:tetratricopeptide (TPR) repeat protein
MSGDRRCVPRLAVASGLLLLAAAAFEGVRRCGFVAFDDNIYLYRNPHVRRGLTWEGLRWAFGADLLFESPHADYWMPVTILSRMMDVQAFGLDAAGHHVMNALFHAVNAALVFLVLDSATAARGRSAFVAAMFAVHPLTVESVAWASERKNVLSALFWILAVMCYGRYATRFSRRAYAGALAMMAVGLMTKPTLVMLPLVLLAVDVWPLGRLTGDRRRPPVTLLVEKIPFLVLSAASSVVTMLALARGDHLIAVETVPIVSRIDNAVWALVLYAWQVVWPTRLAVLYPHTGGGLLAWRTLLAVAVLGAVAWSVARHRHGRPYLVTGLAWYVLPLIPVLGLIQSGQQAHADRFMYIPLVGMGIVCAWGGWDLVRVSHTARLTLPWAAAALLLAWVVLTRAQVRRWESTVSLFSHAIHVTEGNHVAHHNLATALALEGDPAGAERHYLDAVRIRPGYAEARSALGVLLMRQGRLQEALTQEDEALRLAPSSADVHFNLAVLLGRLGRSSDAMARYGDAVRLNPSLAAAHYNWGNLLAAEGRWAEAEARFQEAVRLEPDNLDALNNLGLAIGLQGRWSQAADHFRRALAVDPDHARAHVNLGRALRELGRWDEARAQWREALARWPQDPAVREAREEMARLDSIRAPR